MMKVLSWNINGAWTGMPKDRIQKQVEFLNEYDGPPDIVMLQEVNVYRTEIRGSLKEIGYETIEDTLEWAKELRDSSVQPHQEIGHTNGNLTAVRKGIDLSKKPLELLEGEFKDTDVKHLSTHYPEKILVTDCTIQGQTIEIWNVRAVPGGMKGEEKIKILETVFDRIMNADQRLRILAGDFNTPDEELPDGQAIVNIEDKDPRLRKRWRNAELNILKGLGHVGMVDVFRYLYGYEDIDVRDWSWNGNRFDHIFASEGINPESCIYDHDCLGDGGDAELSDHAPVIAEFSL